MMVFHTSLTTKEIITEFRRYIHPEFRGWIKENKHRKGKGFRFFLRRNYFHPPRTRLPVTVYMFAEAFEKEEITEIHVKMKYGLATPLGALGYLLAIFSCIWYGANQYGLHMGYTVFITFVLFVILATVGYLASKFSDEGIYYQDEMIKFIKSTFSAYGR